MKKKETPHFFALVKDFNSKKMIHIDVMKTLLDEILNKNGSIKKKTFTYLDEHHSLKPVTDKSTLLHFVESELRYYYWAKCEYEFIAIDWPCRDTIDDSNPVKVDVYDQLEPNIPVITDILYDYIKDKL